MITIIKERKVKGLSTYVAFIDMEKAFDRVNRNLLFYKLLSMGIRGKIFKCLKCMYDGCKAGVNVNGYVTDWFETEYGVKQGDCLSPSLFSLYINDLVSDLNINAVGIENNEFSIKCLLYADDIALIGNSVNDLQCMLNTMYEWCKKWQMKVNPGKSKIIHFRTNRIQKTEFSFKYGDVSLDVVDRYKYLGIVFDEHLDYNVTAAVLADSAGRALGAIYNKFKLNKGFGYSTYTKLYESGVTPILDYCSGVWGYNKLEKIDTVQNRALRLYLGVHKFSPNHAINADMGWITSRVRRHVEILRLWNRLINMEDDRLTKKVFMWDKSNRHVWCKGVYDIMNKIGCINAYEFNEPVDLAAAKLKLHDLVCSEWRENVRNTPKLRTYIKFKDEYKTEPYVSVVQNRGHRSVLAQLRSGILPLAIETGRYSNIPPEFRLCLMCTEDVVEDETHFLLHCDLYADLRQLLFTKVIRVDNNFHFYTTDDKLLALMSKENVKSTAEFIYNAFEKRRNTLYR